MQVTTDSANSGFFAGLLVGDPPPAQNTSPATTGGNPETFSYAPGFGQATIANFNGDQDTVQFAPGMFASFNSLISHAAAMGDNTVITTNTHDTLTLQGVTPDQLHASDFHLG